MTVNVITTYMFVVFAVSQFASCMVTVIAVFVAAVVVIVVVVVGGGDVDVFL